MIWKNLLGNTGYFETPLALVPYYRLSTFEMVLFDSGERVLPELVTDLDRMGVRIRAILTTHLHFDHTSNTHILMKRDACEVYATRASYDNVFATHRAGMDHLDFSGIELIGADRTEICVDGVTFKIIPLPGHCPGHIGFVTPDGIIYLGDAMLSRKEIHLAKLPYMEDTMTAIRTIRTIREMDYRMLIMAHRGYVIHDNLADLCDLNLEKEYEIYDQILEISRGCKERAQLIHDVMYNRGIIRQDHLDSPALQYTVSTRIDDLIRMGRLTGFRPDSTMR